MKIDLVAIMAVLYCIALVMQVKRLFVTYRKNAMTSVLSGLLLFMYATFLYITNSDVTNRTLIVILSVSLLQIAAFDVNQSANKMKNIQRQFVLLVFHVVMAYFMLF